MPLDLYAYFEGRNPYRPSEKDKSRIDDVHLRMIHRKAVLFLFIVIIAAFIVIGVLLTMTG